ncbi:hypothetical protein ACIF6K_12230 [Streptomyces sp. NPDC085942]|uniref:hypothetical protein n=1 Tax=Streptomyces sp. NPDC085942 TaxID=3365743 RepID=UPI0037D3116C
MADEHYEWLDKDATEKLLRGEPVVPVGDEARTDAFRLAEALGAAREGLRAPAGELPGEEAALAAFRQAGHGTGADRLAGRPAGAALPGRPGLLPAVHLGPAPGAPVRRPRWSRPVRFGLVASLAGCALGGVAVAAGTGVLPGSFGGQGSPAPATSVSAAATPGPLASGEPTDDPASPADPSSPGGPEASSAPETRESGGPRKPEGAHTGDVGPGPDEDRPGGQDPPDDHARERATGGRHDERPAASGGPGGDGKGAGNWYEKSVKACKAFRNGTLDDRSRRQLVRLAKGEKNLERFCDDLLDGDGGGNGGGGGEGGGSGGHGGSGGNGNGGGGGGDDDDDGPGGPGGDGSLPPVSFNPVPRSAPAPAPAPEAGAGAGSPVLPESGGPAPVRAR